MVVISITYVEQGCNHGNMSECCRKALLKIRSRVAAIYCICKVRIVVVIGINTVGKDWDNVRRM